MAHSPKQRLGVSVRKFADLAGVNDAYVRKRLKGGFLIKMPDGSLDPALATGDWLPRNRRAPKVGKLSDQKFANTIDRVAP